MDRCKRGGQISQGSLQFSEDVSTRVETVFKQFQKVRRIGFFASLQGILHSVKSMTGRFEILSGKECSFFKVIQKTLLRVSVQTKNSFTRMQTLMVDVTEYL